MIPQKKLNLIVSRDWDKSIIGKFKAVKIRDHNWCELSWGITPTYTLFFPSAIKIWNSLSDDIVSSTTLNQFKQKLAGLDLSL